MFIELKVLRALHLLTAPDGYEPDNRYPALATMMRWRRSLVSHTVPYDEWSDLVFDLNPDHVVDPVDAAYQAAVAIEDGILQRAHCGIILCYLLQCVYCNVNLGGGASAWLRPLLAQWTVAADEDRTLIHYVLCAILLCNHAGSGTTDAELIGMIRALLTAKNESK